MHLRSQCNFPWLLANVLDPDLGEDVPLANCDKTCMLVSSNGIKIGVIGLGEREWYAFYPPWSCPQKQTCSDDEQTWACGCSSSNR